MVRAQAINFRAYGAKTVSNILQLRLIARQIFDEALHAVDAGEAVRRALRLDGATLKVSEVCFDLTNRSVFVIAIGKAAEPMALAVESALTGRLSAGFIIGPTTEALWGADRVKRKLSMPWRLVNGAHPLPTKSSLTAAEYSFNLLERAGNDRGLVIFLISGGGSAMIEWPINDRISLANLRIANKALISSGASIGEINAVRRVFSAVKGGKLAARAPNCQQLTLIVSDVPKGREHDVASGPTLASPANAPAAVEVIDRYGLRNQMPESIMQAIDDSAMAEHTTPIDYPYFVLLDNDTALTAAATAASRKELNAKVVRDISDELIELGVKKLLTRLGELKSSKGGTDVCLISGGEFACPVRGDGLGGRNLETALRLAIAADENSGEVGDFVALCAGTDGIDGNSPAAGAIVDSTTIERARRIGLDPVDFLNRSDSYSFFVALGDALTTGATGTNVRDLRILLAPACQNPER